MKGIDKIVGMFRVGKDPSRVRIIDLQISVEAAIIDLHSPVLLREAPLVAGRQIAVGDPGRDAGRAKQRYSKV